MIVTCVDVGSTFTKALAVRDGQLVGVGSHRTTVESDVLVGLDAAVAQTGVAADELLVCSSAGGGLRLAVVGYERLVTAQAGHRVALSAGGKVVHVAAGRLDRDGLAALRASKPDVVLLVGGADGGDTETIIHNATRLAKARWRIPVVLAGNADARSSIVEIMAGMPVVVTGNVLPRIGHLDPGPARAAIREVFLRHVIGGKKLSRGSRFASLVRSATPDAVLSGVELLAAHTQGDLLVVDVGGATTDVYSVLTPGSGEMAEEVAGTMWAARTVEGDLGMRWSAAGVVAAAEAEKLIEPGSLDVSHLDPSIAEDPLDEQIAALAMTVALRRHARGEVIPTCGCEGTPCPHPGPRRGGRDLRAVELVIGSGGVLRHNSPEIAARILAAGLGDTAGGWPLPRSPRTVVDVKYVLAAAGLMAVDHPGEATTLLAQGLG